LISLPAGKAFNRVVGRSTTLHCWKRMRADKNARRNPVYFLHFNWLAR
jgi:hypothetical protein